ncbi:MAG TPA: hypothetical protein VMT30_06000 [Candidatus Saccharimonadia bacterium]|nr:hypothetical protein [Candidatus Saccharimonadia bacterium]
MEKWFTRAGIWILVGVVSCAGFNDGKLTIPGIIGGPITLFVQGIQFVSAHWSEWTGGHGVKVSLPEPSHGGVLAGPWGPNPASVSTPTMLLPGIHPATTGIVLVAA